MSSPSWRYLLLALVRWTEMALGVLLVLLPSCNERAQVHRDPPWKVEPSPSGCYPTLFPVPCTLCTEQATPLSS